MKPIIYIDQQITKAYGKALTISKYIDSHKNLRKSDLREMMRELYHHLNEARNTFPSEENHETEEERNKLPDGI